MQRHLLPSLFLLVVPLVGCAGELVALSTEPVETDPLLQNCGVLALEKSCTSTDGSCHGPPAIMGLDLSLAGIQAAHHGADFVGKAPSDDIVNGAACSPLSTPPVMGLLLVDSKKPEESLLFTKMSASPICGSHMPVLTRKGQPPTVSAVDQACILDWIRSLPGVMP